MNYSSLITETEVELTELETKQSLCINRDRIRFLKLLKHNKSPHKPLPEKHSVWANDKPSGFGQYIAKKDSPD